MGLAASQGSPAVSGVCPHGRRMRRIAATVLAVLLAVWPLRADAQEAVDVELVLAVDTSLSMSPAELVIQRDGYAAALRHDEVLQAIRNGVHGRIAITYFEWAGDASQRVIVPWTVIASRADAERVAGRLNARPPASARRTSISGAMNFALDLFAEGRFRGLRRIVDISGDGPNNQGAPVDVTRDALVARGITINGLPLMTNGGLRSSFSISDLDIYYTDCVTGGPGSFVVPVNDWSQFPTAVRRKLVVELAGGSALQGVGRPLAPVVRADVSGTPLPAAHGGFDCLIGEKIWNRRSNRRPSP